ncbi:MAG: hypothetical protein BA863_17805 [Desulfovibrio sp. S3730MH75]|nr:MAG: hypothetical protein BA863_17805 [Desulfovibrio sp. S3730MH75]
MPESQNSPTEIGVITGLTGEAYAESDSGSRVLEPGSPIFQGEQLVTGPAGNIEVRFVDDTLLSQGGNSRITLDDYVYDTTDTSASELLLDITEGTFRVVTGKIAEQNPERFKVGSPLATIGIRGTITVHEVQPGGIEKHGVEEIHSGKALIVQSNIDGAIRQIANPLGMVDVSPSGMLSPVRPLSPQEFNTFREIAPANIREEREIIQERQDEDDEDTPEEQQGEGEPVEGEPLPGDVAPGGGDPLGEAGGLQGTQGVVGQPPVEPPVGPPVGQGPDNGRGGPVFREPPIEPKDDIPEKPIDPLDDPIDIVKPVVTTTDDDDSDGDGDGDNDATTYNTITGTEGADNRTGTSGADKMLGLGGDDVLNGMDGDDSLSGGDGADTLSGGKGDDILDGGTSPDDIDFASYSDASGSVTVNLATNTATGADGNDVLNNIEGVIGSGYNDTLTGDENNNWFEGLNGNDNIYGEGGYDGVSYEQAEDTVTVHLGGGTAYGAAGSDYLESIENVIGSKSADNITGSGEDNTLYGGRGNDVIDGMNGDDTIYGEGGNDVLLGGNGVNSIDGGSGVDSVSYIHSTSGVTIDVAAKSAIHCGGTDTILNIESFIGSNHDDSMTGGTGNEQFFGGQGNNVIDGGDGFDIVSFASSTSGVVFTVNNVGPLTTITHSGGDDTISNIEGFIGSYVTTESDNMTGSDDVAETFFGTLGDDTYDGKGIGLSGGVDTLSYALIEGKMDITMDDCMATATTGTAFTDHFSNIEKIIGSSYDDTIQGKMDSSEETIQGGKGSDTINLGNATTTLSYVSLADGGDTIDNFDSATDKFHFSGSDFDPAAKTATFMTINSAYSGSDGLFGGDSEAHFVYDTACNILWYDSNGDEPGEATKIATISSGDDVTAADIIF